MVVLGQFFPFGYPSNINEVEPPEKYAKVIGDHHPNMVDN